MLHVILEVVAVRVVGPSLGIFGYIFAWTLILPVWAAGFQTYKYHDNQTVTDFWSFIGAWYWCILVWPFTIFGWFWLLILAAAAACLLILVASENQKFENLAVSIVGITLLAIVVPLVFVFIAMIAMIFE